MGTRPERTFAGFIAVGAGLFALFIGVMLAALSHG